MKIVSGLSKNIGLFCSFQERYCSDLAPGGVPPAPPAVSVEKPSVWWFRKVPALSSANIVPTVSAFLRIYVCDPLEYVVPLRDSRQASPLRARRFRQA